MCPLPLPIAPAFCPSALLSLPADILAVEGRQLGLGAAASRPQIPQPPSLGLSPLLGTPPTPLPSTKPSVGHLFLAGRLAVSSFFPSRKQGPALFPRPGGHLHHDGALLRGGQASQPPGGSPPAILITLRVVLIGLRQTKRRGRPRLPGELTHFSISATLANDIAPNPPGGDRDWYCQWPSRDAVPRGGGLAPSPLPAGDG